MFSPRRFVPFLLLFLCLPTFAQSLPLLTATASGTSVRYAGFGEVRDMRLEILGEEGQTVFDIAFKRGNLLDYALIDTSGRRLADGSYLFVVTLRDLDYLESQKYGILQIADRRVMLLNAGAKALSPAQTAALKRGDRAPSAVDQIGIEMPAEAQPASIVIAPPPEHASIVAIPRADVAGTGTTNQITKWTDAAGTLGDSAIAEVSGRVGIGTTTPGGQLHIFGLAGQDVFAGMGPNLTAGPAMNFGYGGATFGRGSGFFNVRPGGGSVAPNPSLRFMTGDVQRMIISNLGNVGINTGFSAGTAPTDRLEVGGNIKLRFPGSRLIFTDDSSMSTAGASLGANTFTADQVVQGDIQATFGIFADTGFFTGSITTNGAVSAAQLNFASVRVFKATAFKVFAGINAGSVNTANQVVFVGTDAGKMNTTGFGNTFVGDQAGSSNTTGVVNTFVGRLAGALNVTGEQNTVFGSTAGSQMTDASHNSFFGVDAGAGMTASDNSCFGDSAGKGDGDPTKVGARNAFFGRASGQHITSGADNTFVGYFSGTANSTGASNVFIGANSGNANISGSANTIIGANAGQSNTSETSNTFIGFSANGASFITNATAIGRRASVTQSNSVVLGSISGVNGAGTSARVGIGTTAPQAALHVAVDDGDIFLGDAGCDPGFVGIGFAPMTLCDDYSLLGNGTDTIINRPTGGDISFREDNFNQMTIEAGGEVGIGTSAPHAKVHVAGGDVAISSQSSGLILRATDGSNCFRVTVNNAGTLDTTLLACP